MVNRGGVNPVVLRVRAEKLDDARLKFVVPAGAAEPALPGRRRSGPLGGHLVIGVRHNAVHLTVRAEPVEACSYCHDPSTSSGRTEWSLLNEQHWGQTPISLRCTASHPLGKPEAWRIWALTSKTNVRATHSSQVVNSSALTRGVRKVLTSAVSSA